MQTNPTNSPIEHLRWFCSDRGFRLSGSEIRTSTMADSEAEIG